MDKTTIDDLTAFCKRKGFVYSSGEIYGGLAGFYDYGHLGAPLKKNFETLWRKYFLELHDNFYEIEASEIMPEKVFIASGHLKNFADLAVKCKKGHFGRVDQILESKFQKTFDGTSSEEIYSLIKKNKIVCSICRSEITSVEAVNMMFPIQLGVGNTTTAFLRPETAQGPYVNFKLQYEATRNKLPLGLAMIGKAYRNELSPRNLLLRQRAFTQAELQIFFNPSKINEHSDFDNIAEYKLRVVLSDKREKGIQEMSCASLAKRVPKFYVYYMARVQQFYLEKLQFSKNAFRFYELPEKERAFYNLYHFDIEADMGALGWTELGGVHYRTDHDLRGHQTVSKQNLSIFDEETKEKFIPHVLELSFGVDRNFQAILTFAYEYDKKRDNIILHLLPCLSPIKAALFPIVKDNAMVRLAKEIYSLLREEWNVFYDESGSIGRRYSRQDETGTPLCITIDEQSLKDKTATLRDRDTTKQIRVNISDIPVIIRNVVSGKSLLKLGDVVETRVK